MTSRLLPIYLNDHLAGSTLGLALVTRMLRENAGTELEPVLATLATEIEDDRRTLLETMTRLSITPSRVKVAAARSAERLGLLKLNGRLRGYSPLSRLLELEGLSAVIEAKRALWVALAQVGDDRLEGLDLVGLADRALAQKNRLAPYLESAARDALA